MDFTLEYYEKNANKFVEDTINVDFKNTQNHFLKLIPKGSKILDFGCGAGRDTKYFLEKGFFVDAVDGSEKLCKVASEYAGVHVRKMFFQDLNEIEKYDGIWACASILHLPYSELVSVFHKMVQALRLDGIIYTSFKYGDFEGEKNGRFFTYMTEEKIANLLLQISEIELLEQWISSDVRNDRGDEKWLNIILKKTTI